VAISRHFPARKFCVCGDLEKVYTSSFLRPRAALQTDTELKRIAASLSLPATNPGVGDTPPAQRELLVPENSALLP
jgi:hypothetical protein